MIILDMELTHFGKFHNKKIDLTSGVNVIYGKNEAGKTTIHAFIRGMLFGIDKLRGRASKTDRYAHYEPWKNEGGYEGKMRIFVDGITYRLERSFLRSNRYFRLIDETNGINLEPAEEHLVRILQGLNETNYVNTISIEQMKSSTEIVLMDELQRFITNTGASKSIEIDLGEAIETLMVQKKQVKGLILEEAYDESTACKKRIEDLKWDIGELRKSLETNAAKQIEVSNFFEEAKVNNTKQSEAYHNKLDQLRSKYEDSRVTLASMAKPDVEAMEKRNRTSTFFYGLAVLFAAATIYMSLTIRKFSTEQRVAMIVFGVIALVLLIAARVDTVLVERKKRKLAEAMVKYEEIQALVSQNEQEYMAYKEAGTPLSEDAAKIKELLDALVVERERTSWEIERREEELQTLYSREQILENVLKENAEKTEELAALELSIEMLKKVSEQVHDSFGSQLNKEASSVLSIITKGKYTHIVVSQDMKIALNTKERLIPIEQVSAGTMEQVYLCIRIAAAKLLWKKEMMPFIFDDVFAFYDDERLEATIRYLQATGRQVIILSSHIREEKYLKEQKGL